MKNRFVFTMRDWLWLCIIIALAGGWGTHVRYSYLFERDLPTYDTPPSVASIQTELSTERAARFDTMVRLNSLNRAMQNVLSSEQQNQILIEEAKEQAQAEAELHGMPGHVAPAVQE